ncbi:MAG: dihydrofolate reductase, partial [Candidatus Pacebacteria bacterium]|nr:dihydrofolate reductase [Candidatus Paceibacterota bacterium]
TTAGHPVIMGLNTYKSIGRPLPQRTNIVLSKDDEEIEGCLMAHSLEEAFDLAKENSENIFVIGGASVYEQTLPFADTLNLTLIDAEVDGDIFFPEFNHDEWKEVSREERKADEKNIYDMSFVKYIRK